MSDEKWASNTLQKWKPVIDSFDIDFEEQEKLAALAKRDKRVMRLVLKELEYTDAENREHYAGSIACMLGRAAAQEAIPSLRKILMNKRESEPMRFSAARAIGLIGMPGLPDLADVIIKFRDVLARSLAVDAISAIVDPNRNPRPPRKGEMDPYDLLVTAMQDDAAPVRENALGVFESVIPPAVGEPYLIKALQNPNPFVRACVADALIKYKLHHIEAQRTLGELLEHAKPKVRLQALRGLRHEGRPYTDALVPPLHALLRDKDGLIRAGAARALANLGTAASPAMEDLLKILKCKFESEAEFIACGEAATALGRIGHAAKVAVPTLIVLIKMNDYEIRLRAVNALGQIGPGAGAAIPALEEMLPGLDYRELREAVRKALGKIRSKKKRSNVSDQ